MPPMMCSVAGVPLSAHIVISVAIGGWFVTTWLSVLVLGRSVASPEYCAMTMLVPRGNAAVATLVAEPLLKVCVSKSTPLVRKVIVPVAALGETLAVKLMLSLYPDGFSDETSVVIVGVPTTNMTLPSLVVTVAG